RGDPRRLRLARRQPHGRARDRRREDRADAAPLLARRPPRPAAPPRGVRPRRARQPAQAVPRRQGLCRDARSAAAGGRMTAASASGDDAVAGVAPRRVVRPASVDEVRAAVREAGARHDCLVALGRGGHRDLGGPPSRLDLVVRLDALDRIVDHQAGDMTVTVEAGCPLAAVQSVLAGAGQWLPLDPPRPDATTIGGLVAADLSGPLRASQGTVRDLLLGIAVVGADGALVRGGGRVVKNVAGYDLPKLHVGAFGTLGIVVEATFKVRPRPE